MLSDKNIKKVLAGFIFTLWLLFVVYIIFDLAFLENSLNITEVLYESSFTRIMFNDIGLLSTMVAMWIVANGRYKSRFIFAILTLFLGATIAAPYVAYTLWNAYSEEVTTPTVEVLSESNIEA